MKLTIENIISLVVLMLAEAWFLTGGREWESAITLIASFGAIFAKEPIKKRFGWGIESLEHDRRLFADFLNALPVEPLVRLLKHHDFGDAFRKHEVDPLYAFVSTWGDVDREFLDKGLETLRRSLYSSASALATEVARRTVPVGSGDFCSVYSDSRRAAGPRPLSVIEDARILNDMARDFVPLYESFVRSCKSKLAE